MRRWLSVLICLLLARTASADPIKVVLPDGEMAFVIEGTTAGEFICSNAFYACTSTGPTMTLFNGPLSATFTFSGIQDTWLLGGLNGGRILPIGAITSTSDPGFTFPVAGIQNIEMFRFNLALHHLTPIDATQVSHVRFGPTYASGGTSLPLYSGDGEIIFPTFIDPQLGPVTFVYTLLPFTLPTQGQFTVEVLGTAVPEPTSILLIGPALIGLWKRRQRARRGTSLLSYGAP